MAARCNRRAVSVTPVKVLDVKPTCHDRGHEGLPPTPRSTPHHLDVRPRPTTTTAITTTAAGSAHRQHGQRLAPSPHHHHSGEHQGADRRPIAGRHRIIAPSSRRDIPAAAHRRRTRQRTEAAPPSRRGQAAGARPLGKAVQRAGAAGLQDHRAGRASAQAATRRRFSCCEKQPRCCPLARSIVAWYQTQADVRAGNGAAIQRHDAMSTTCSDLGRS
jgi:hypothetical protein